VRTSTPRVEAAIQEHPDVAVGGGHRPSRRRHGEHRARGDRGRPADRLPRGSPSFVAERVARYKVPRSVEYTDQPLRNEAGKLRRSSLRADGPVACSKLNRRFPRSSWCREGHDDTDDGQQQRARGDEAEETLPVGHRGSPLRPGARQDVKTTDHTITAAPMSPSAPHGQFPAAARRDAGAPPHTPRPPDRRFQERTVRSAASPTFRRSRRACHGAQPVPKAAITTAIAPIDHDADGQDQWHPRTRQRITPTHRPLVGAPLPEALRRHDRTQGDERQPQEPAAPLHLEFGEELRRGDSRGDQCQGRAIPGEERPLVGVGEPTSGSSSWWDPAPSVIDALGGGTWSDTGLETRKPGVAGHRKNSTVPGGHIVTLGQPLPGDIPHQAHSNSIRPEPISSGFAEMDEVAMGLCDD